MKLEHDNEMVLRKCMGIYDNKKVIKATILRSSIVRSHCEMSLIKVEVVLDQKYCLKHRNPVKRYLWLCSCSDCTYSRPAETFVSFIKILFD